MAASPTSRTLEKLKKEGWLADVVERYIHAARVRKDCYGFIDILSIRGGETLAVQATSYSNVSSRVKKIKEHENLQTVLDAGWKVEVWGWHKKGNRWTVRIVEVTDGHHDGSNTEQVAKADVRCRQREVRTVGGGSAR